MPNIRNFFKRICIVHENTIYKTFIVGFLNDGGYFISDFSNSLEYIATKIKIDGGHVRELIKKELDSNNTYNISLRKPKLSHHFDGTSHISGKDIISGYNTDGSSKGLSIKSFPLSKENDGGPVFGIDIGIVTLKQFPIIDNTELNKKYLILNNSYIIDLRKNNNEIFHYTIECYYILKSKIGIGKKYLKINHNVYGEVTLKIIETPPNTPGVFGFLAIKDTLGADGNDFFSLNGSPGIIEDNSRDMLAIFKNEIIHEQEYKTLNHTK